MRRDEDHKIKNEPLLDLDLPPDKSISASAFPEGFSYHPEMITKGDEQRLIRCFATLPFKPFEFRGYLGNRRIVSYGYRYDYSARALQESLPFPSFLIDLQKTAAAFAQVETEEVTQALITEYAPGVGIGWHRDKPMFENVIAFSFGAPCLLRLRRKAEEKWERASINLNPRSAYILQDEARWEWEHSIPPATDLRYSVTFRNFVRK